MPARTSPPRLLIWTRKFDDQPPPPPRCCSPTTHNETKQVLQRSAEGFAAEADKLRRLQMMMIAVPRVVDTAQLPRLLDTTLNFGERMIIRHRLGAYLRFEPACGGETVHAAGCASIALLLRFQTRGAPRPSLAGVL